jgi:O-phosphoseryl-tRNA(Cys) synthetase
METLKTDVMEIEDMYSEVVVQKVPALVEAGKKGVTNAQMIPAIRKYLEASDTTSLKLLSEQFPQVYTSSIKYLTKDQKAKLEALG